MKSVTASAPAKVILGGEHAVVHGTNALACAIALHTTVNLSSSTSSTGADEQIHLALPPSVTTKKLTIARSSLKAVEALQSELTDDVVEAVKGIVKQCCSELAEEAITAVGVCMYLLAHLGSGSSAEEWPTNIDVTTTVPIGAGLGSSASYCVALACALLKWFQHDTSKENVSQWAYKGETIIHGKPSGVDNTVITHGSGLLFKRTAGEVVLQFLQPIAPLKFLIFNTKVPKSTKALVAGVKQRKEKLPAIVDPIIDSIDHIVLEEFNLLKKDRQLTESEFDLLQVLITMNHSLLNGLGVGHPAIERVVEICVKAGIKAVKLTGAGGGGCVIAVVQSLSDETEKQLMNAIEPLGFDLFSVELDVKGAV